MVGVSQQAVSALVTRRVLLPGASGGVWLRAYCENLREQAAGRRSEGNLDLVQERARLAREQADRVAMENAIERKELAPVAVIEQVLAAVGRQVAGILEAIPVQIKRRSDAISKQDLDFIEQEIVKARNLAAAIELNLEELDAVAGADEESDQDRAEGA